MTAIDYIRGKFESWSRLGKIQEKDGSCIFAHTPRDFPHAYLHSFFAPKKPNAWKKYGMELPVHLESLYKVSNGLQMFSGSISIYGIRTDHVRDGSAQFQPFDLQTHDQEAREFWHKLNSSKPDDRVFFGSYEEDGSGVFTTQTSKEVFRCERRSHEPLNS